MPAEIPELKQNVKLIQFIDADHRFEHPVWFGPVPGVAHTFAVVEHETGKIWLLDKGSGRETKTVFLRPAAT